MDSASIIVATFGDASWRDLAHSRAVRSAEHLRGDVGYEIIEVHSDSLAHARNLGAHQAQGDWLCFLDADDELDSGYLSAMSAGTLALRAPAVQYVKPDGKREAPVTYADRNIKRTNPCVIGTMLTRDLFDRAGGFLDEPIFEDWSLFLRCVKHGAEIEHLPKAVYVAHVRERSRNNQEGRVRLDTYNKIREAYA